MTKKENFVAINAILKEMGHNEFDEFIAHEIELLARKRSGSKTPTKRQVENEGIKAQIAEVLSADEGKTVTEILKALDNEVLTNQRVSALLRQMGGVRKEFVKGKALFFAE